MKKIYACMVALATGTLVNAQTLTQSNNAFVSGDMFSNIHCDSINVSPGASGANAVWNFGSLIIYNNVVNNYTAAASTSGSYPAGSIDVASSVNNQMYLVSSPTDLRYYGGNISVGSIAATLTYSSPAVYASYPMSLSTSSNCTTGGAINIISPPVSGIFIGTSVANADGSGTLILPGGSAGTYTSVLRLVTTQVITYTASGITGSVTQQSYNYYTPTVKAPLLTILTTTITSSIGAPTSQTTTTINKNYLQTGTPSSIATNKMEVTDLLVYPNPASGSVIFSTESKAVKEIKVCDITGKLIEKQNFGEGNLKLDLSNYNKGLYIYSLLNSDGETLKTGKLTVN